MKITHILLVIASIVVAVLNSSCATSTNYGAGGYSAKGHCVPGGPQVATSNAKFSLIDIEIRPGVSGYVGSGGGYRPSCPPPGYGRPPMPPPGYGRPQCPPPGYGQRRPQYPPQGYGRPPSRYGDSAYNGYNGRRPPTQRPPCPSQGYGQPRPQYPPQGYNQGRPQLPPGSRVIHGVVFNDQYPAGRRIAPP